MSPVRGAYGRALDLPHGRIDLTHGSGGRAMAQLIDELFARWLGNAYLGQGNDAAVLPMPAGRLVMSTDSHVVSPLFFPGGDIGCLAVHGTINDVAVMGATPLYLAASFILEEGFALHALARIVESMARAATAAGVPVVTGDTKVVEQGKGDGVYITTTGVGVVGDGEDYSGDRARPGDRIIVSGGIGEHGMAIMAQRESIGFAAHIVSDTAALHGLIAAMRASRAAIRVLRDPTPNEGKLIVAPDFRYNPTVFRSPLRGQQFFGDGRFAHFLFVAMDLHEVLDKTVTGLGYELVDVEQSPRGRVLRVFIDKPDKPAVSMSKTVRWSAISCRGC
jgi:hydrogenase expression/formation protein HypE